jgi:hypothetical protein
MNYQDQKDFDDLSAQLDAMKASQAIRDELAETLAVFLRNPSAANYTKHTEAMTHWQNWCIVLGQR